MRKRKISCSITNPGNYRKKTPVRIWKRYIPLLIDLLISNNFASYFLRVIGRQSIRQSTDFLLIFCIIKKKQVK